jgi:hypothetical protein
MVSSPNPASKYLLLRLAPECAQNRMNYAVIEQTAEEVQNIQNAPSISMCAYLISSE